MYKVEFGEGNHINILNTSLNSDNTLNITTDKSSLNSFLSNKPIYKFKKAYPLFTTPRLQRIYLLEVPVSFNVTLFLQRNDVVRLVPYEEVTPVLLSNTEPNDYIENLQEDRPNPALDLIKAPLARSITTGDPDIYIGIVDADFLVTHEDLQGKIVENYDDSSYTNFEWLKHGTRVASIAAGNTNNGIGMAVIGYNTSLIVADQHGSVNRVKEISLIPGVKVINCSWIGCTYDPDDAECYQEILDSGVLVVAGAGNGTQGNSCGSDSHGYAYPASYESVISVTSVGSRNDINEYHDLVIPETGEPYWAQSWKDHHLYKPAQHPDESTTHNDKVNVSHQVFLYKWLPLLQMV